jgi:hypothetical protein
MATLIAIALCFSAIAVGRMAWRWWTVGRHDWRPVRIQVRAPGHRLRSGDRIRGSARSVFDDRHLHANPTWDETLQVAVLDENHFAVTVMALPSPNLVFSWRHLDSRAYTEATDNDRQLARTASKY